MSRRRPADIGDAIEWLGALSRTLSNAMAADARRFDREIQAWASNAARRIEARKNARRRRYVRAD